MLQPFSRGQTVGIVTFTRPDGKVIAIHSDAWQTVTEFVGEPKEAHTQIGFSGAQSAIVVREVFKDVIAALKKADEEDDKKG